MGSAAVCDCALLGLFSYPFFLHVCPGEMFISDSRLAFFWEGNCPFGFLLVVF